MIERQGEYISQNSCITYGCMLTNNKPFYEMDILSEILKIKKEKNLGVITTITSLKNSKQLLEQKNNYEKNSNCILPINVYISVLDFCEDDEEIRMVQDYSIYIKGNIFDK